MRSYRVQITCAGRIVEREIIADSSALALAAALADLPDADPRSTVIRVKANPLSNPSNTRG